MDSWKLNRLLEILSRMDVPEQRKMDFRWLNRNLAIRNSSHPDFPEAVSIIKKMLIAGTGGWTVVGVNQ